MMSQPKKRLEMVWNTVTFLQNGLQKINASRRKILEPGGKHFSDYKQRNPLQISTLRSANRRIQFCLGPWVGVTCEL